MSSIPNELTHFRMSGRDLELILDKVPIDYPALLKEAFLNNWHASAHRTEVTSDCASLNEKYCWVLSRNQIFIWERTKSSAHRSTQLPLPPSGLPRSVKCVVVYDGIHRGANKQQSAGVLVISPEGVLRHWTSIESNCFHEQVLDINSEVALRVELTDEPCDGKSASFLLTTTSGTVYFLHGEAADSGKTGALECHKVTSREAHGFRRRLSSIMFGAGPKDSTTFVTNSFQYQSKDILVVAVSPDVLTVYNMSTPCELWSLKSKEFFQPMLTEFFESELKKVPMMVKARIIDAAVFREGLMILVGGTHEESQLVHTFVIWTGPSWQYEQPTKSVWSAKVPMGEHRALFLKSDDVIYNNLKLCIPKDTAESKKAERTDGIIIINPYFAVSLYLPFDLAKPKKNDLSHYKQVSLPASDQLIGYAICKQYVYVMMLESGISTVRLLPRGFSDGSVLYNHDQIVVPSMAAGTEDWAVFSNFLSEIVAVNLPKSSVLQALHKSFEMFMNKDMVQSAKLLEPVAKLADQEMARVVTQFLNAIIDYSDAANKTEEELHAKRVLTSRMMLFLKHMGIFERILNSPLAVLRSGVLTLRAGALTLAEVSERVATASGIWAWRNSTETHAAIFDTVIEKVLRLPEVQEHGLKDKDALFGRCGMVHFIPVVAAKQLDKSIVGKAKSHKFEVFHAICDMLLAIKDAILGWRSCRTKVSIPKIIGWWTLDTFASCYREVAERIIEELREGTASDSERTRLLIYVLSIYDFYLGECDERPDNDKILHDLISLGKAADAMDLAEKHKDFGTLIRNHLTTDLVTRQKTFDRYKKTYANDDFEMYLCDYLKKQGRNDVLLQQGGKRVDDYLENFKELRYSREIANKQFGKAAVTLMSLADSERKSFAKFSDFLTRSNYCASLCSPEEGVDVSEVIDFYKRRLPEMKHRKRIPLEILNAGYGGDSDVMMSVEEMIEWNMTNQTNDEATIDGFARAFHLLADLVAAHEPSKELQGKIDKMWKALVDYDEWNRVKSKEDVEKKTIFGKFCDYLIKSYPPLKGGSFPAWMPTSRLLIMPSDMGEIMDDSTANTTGNHVSWIKGHVKWTVEQLSRQARLPKSAFFRPDTENVGSLAQAAIAGFGPIFEKREQRLNVLLNKKAAMEH